VALAISVRSLIAFPIVLAGRTMLVIMEPDADLAADWVCV
jgi:hypothetical protein